MRPDSIEFGWAQTVAERQRTAGAPRLRRDRSPAPHLVQKAVVDEAFAVFENTADKLRPSEIAGRSNELAPVAPSLIATLSAQLDALDRQREQLASLLNSINSASTPASVWHLISRAARFVTTVR
jgi:hypothetical protein